MTDDILERPRGEAIHGVPPGLDALTLAETARSADGVLTVHIARDDVRLRLLADQMAAFAPDVSVLLFPAWDCVPYDRVSPNAAIVAERVATLARLAASGAAPQAASTTPRLLLTTVNAVLQRIPPLESLQGQSRAIRTGELIALEDLSRFLADKGYLRTEVVMEPGEFAVRGGLLDVFPTGAETPYRLDFFGDEVEEIRTFDPVSQRSAEHVPEIAFLPMGEVVLSEAAIATFRRRYRELFGAASSDDALYATISDGQRMAGMEHWLPLFHEQGLDTLFASLGEGARLSADGDVDGAIAARLAQISDFYEARRVLDPASGGRKAPEAGLSTGDLYHPVPPNLLYLTDEDLNRLFMAFGLKRFSRFGAAEDKLAGDTDLGGRPGRDFADVRARPDGALIPEVMAHIRRQMAEGRRVTVCAYSNGAAARITVLLAAEAEGTDLHVFTATDWAQAANSGAQEVPVVVVPLQSGFATPDLAVVTEADIFGDRLVRAAKKARRGDKIIADVTSIEDGDLLVHAEHGIGRFAGLKTIDVGGAAHDCLLLLYAGDDRLYVPVENIDVLSRFGSEQAGVTLDKLGGTAWQARKAKLKQRMADMAEHLIRIAAAREMKTADRLLPSAGTFEEFCARFPYHETEDQLSAIADTIDDMGKGRPMDRLVCGDVGFGKTEVALRAAFVAAMSGVQVAMVAPTTLLVRQHFKTFQERFAGFGLKIVQLSRLVNAKGAKAAREGLEDGSVNIVVGTHALLAKSIKFASLGLLIVDEEQHFGVSHKERLKELKSDVHVLTLTATPIPRTLQLALTGVRQLSIIATPPVDRLAVRTFVLPFDGVIIREALMRERFRGGQAFYVCPRVADLDRVRERLERIAPELTCVIAHGQMVPSVLEEVMTAFADGKYDVLLSTNIIESGLDLPRVNTIVIHRADMFGLAQLYQLRGRVGRGKERGYAYLTLPPGRALTEAAQKRLDVMQSLDTLGAGFTLASHDLDIRGAGNLLGEEQSGHIKEVGIELYQHLLQEAVAAARDSGRHAGAEGGQGTESFSPVINVGAAVLLPDSYVPDLGLRLSLYRQIGDLKDAQEIEGFAAGLIDRFGPLPEEVSNLLAVVGIKSLCRTAHIEKVDAGPKGATIAFYRDTFPEPAGLVAFIARQAGTVKVRADQRLVVLRGWQDPQSRISGLKALIGQLAEIAQGTTTS